MFAHLLKTQTSLRDDVEALVQSMCRARQIEALAAGRDTLDAPRGQGSVPAIHQPTKYFW